MIFWEKTKKKYSFILFPKGGPFGVETVKSFFFFQFFKVSKFFFQKQLHWDQTGTEINKVKTTKLRKWQTVLGRSGPKDNPTPSRNRVK